MGSFSIIILTYNEESNLPSCLDSLVDLNVPIFVVDSFSTDRTLEILNARNIEFTQHAFENYAIQRNWAQEHCPHETEWIFHLDAGERVSEELKLWLKSSFNPDTNIDGFMFSRRTFFLGKWIRHGGHYPNFHLRLFRKSKGHCEAKAYDQHFIVEGEVQKIRNRSDIIDEVSDTIHAFIQSHSKWALFEAIETISKTSEQGEVQAKWNGNPIERQRWLKQYLFQRTPLFVRSLFYFIYRYFLRMGFLDGIPGLIFHFLQGFWFRFLIDAHVYEITERMKRTGHPLEELVEHSFGANFLPAIAKQKETYVRHQRHFPTESND